MKCVLCEKTIGNYSREFNHLEIDDTRSADICGDCAEKIVKLQGRKYAALFPTRMMKKRSEKKQGLRP